MMKHIGVQKEAWLENMAKWSVTPESAMERAIEGVNEMVGDKAFEELEAWRDERLAKLIGLLWNRD